MACSFRLSLGLPPHLLGYETQKLTRIPSVVSLSCRSGATSTKTLSRLTQQETNQRLKEHEASYSVSRKANPVYRYDTAQLASNSPIEDDLCTFILERDSKGAAGGRKGDLVFWGVFGESGRCV